MMKFARWLAGLLGALLAWARARLSRDETRKAGEPHGSYRKCPKCAERDFRLCDKQRAHPEIYRSRAFCAKWLCLACGYRETEYIEEPE